MDILSINGSSKLGARPVQQDRFAYMSIGECAILVVADGNGGEGGGELAEVAVKSAASSICWCLVRGGRFETSEELESAGLGAIDAAVKEAVWLKHKHREWVEAGTTLTLVVVTSWLVGVFWIGDSPAYIFADGKLGQITKPHTHYEQLLDSGKHTKESLEGQPWTKSTLTQCIAQTVCEPGSRVMPFEGDITVLAGSDGVFSYLLEEEIKSILQQSLNNDVTRKLVQEAIDNSSDDNLTAVIASVASRQKPTRFFRTWWSFVYMLKNKKEGGNKK